MTKRFVEYRGTRMIEGWPERIKEAQLLHTLYRSGRAFRRISYGSELEDWGADQRPCHDCHVIKGELHVLGCDVERCPACHEQLLTCDCEFDDAAV